MVGAFGSCVSLLDPTPVQESGTKAYPPLKRMAEIWISVRERGGEFFLSASVRCAMARAAFLIRLISPCTSPFSCLGSPGIS